ncbi:hypothetical protein PT974_09226 [Cladobotryum mycophilum]|uniref:Mid2 domain-containing protein n=1 Tax=Cladobotryum mycophilum TaxID=491253 RepID=A0ABR0SGZ1_9HYPO
MDINSPTGRDSTACPGGTFFYSCGANDFRGCCSTDPCALLSCPDSLGSKKNPKEKGDNEPIEVTEITLFPFPTTTSTQKGDKKSQETEASTTMDESKPAKETTTMTDSGITHTIPNNSVVTVTMHTTITTKRPSPTTSSADPASSADATLDDTGDTSGATTAAPTETDGIGSSNGAGAGRLSSGTIIGIAVGGAIVIAILGVMAIFLIRRRKRKARSNTYSTYNQDNGGDDLVEEKHFPQALSTHTTGTQGSSDPFAPFGGRADQPDDLYRPHSGTFEMDGTTTTPVELPANSIPSPSTAASKAPRLDPVQEIVPADPRANLNSLQTESGKPAYVNHWNQYKNLG